MLDETEEMTEWIQSSVCFHMGKCIYCGARFTDNSKTYLISTNNTYNASSLEYSQSEILSGKSGRYI